MASLGQKRVGVNFNPSGDEDVGRIKALAATMIDTINAVASPPGDDTDPDYLIASAEFARAKSIAMRHVETAAMYAVKAVTARRLDFPVREV